MQGETKYDNLIRCAIYSNKIFKIDDIIGLQELSSTVLLRSDYPKILKLVEAGDIKSLQRLPDNRGKSSEYLDIYLFKDRAQQQYIVTIYDSDEMWQDPQVWDVIKLSAH